MSKYKVFYLDDEKEDLTIPYKKKLEITDLLDISLNKPYNFEKELDRLIEELKSCDALILDLQLDGPQEDDSNKEGKDGKENNANEDEKKFKVRYQAPPLAQMIRTLASEGAIPDLPIILCSTEDKVKDSFNRDFTSHDLFDWTFLKDDIDVETINKIVSLIVGYQTLNKNKKDFSTSLGRDYNELDQRILSRFIIEDNPPTHEIARVIFKDIVQPTGLLINESTLAARLGVDMSKNVEYWNKFIDKYFSKTKYDGVFHTSWNRWWNDRINDVFEEITNENLASLDATSRVSLLIEKTEFKDLIVAEPIKLFESNNYWNICEITKKPLDPFEGFKISGKEEPKPWQDYAYVSLFAYVTKPDSINKKGIKIHPSDSERMRVERKKID
ncbi:hypothetical protein [Polaribacter butkevichii]|uniref:Uncharacterized protein n=1 Tax=Polaribacter butkevichii TaxID=218490 RepID=A0A2P6CDD7_9FLAO|nr:hypothetical protein [Polaribacter butkevichii]PQJ72913.1 hypothetical protein BTO14_06435 [Polaribacter butkevichii]